MTSIEDAPDGFEPHRSSPFAAHVGGLFVDRSTTPPTFGLRIAEHHANTAGSAHGGVLSTLADLVLGQGIRAVAPDARGLVTAGLSIDYAAAVPVGAWVHAQADVQRATARAAFASCYILHGDRRVARASGIYVSTGNGDG